MNRTTLNNALWQGSVVLEGVVMGAWVMAPVVPWVLAIVLAGCGGPRSLPKGPPPEYEPRPVTSYEVKAAADPLEDVLLDLPQAVPRHSASNDAGVAPREEGGASPAPTLLRAPHAVPTGAVSTMGPLPLPTSGAVKPKKVHAGESKTSDPASATQEH